MVYEVQHLMRIYIAWGQGHFLLGVALAGWLAGARGGWPWGGRDLHPDIRARLEPRLMVFGLSLHTKC